MVGYRKLRKAFGTFYAAIGQSIGDTFVVDAILFLNVLRVTACVAMYKIAVDAADVGSFEVYRGGDYTVINDGDIVRNIKRKRIGVKGIDAQANKEKKYADSRKPRKRLCCV